MKSFLRLAGYGLGAGLLSLAFIAAGAADSGVSEEVIRVSRLDGSTIELRLARPARAGKVGLLLYLDGSLCLPSALPEVLQRMGEADGSLDDVATLIVEKPGVSVGEQTEGEVRIDSSHECSTEFLRYYSIEQRILDHLRALQYLRSRVSWWNGDLLVWGFSDGGAIGASVASYFEGTRRAALFGFGGGLPFTALWKDHFLCAGKEGGERVACVDDLEERFETMRRNPSTEETWMGGSNTWQTWVGRLDSVPARVLFDAVFPTLIVHGEEDGSVPVESARAALQMLRQPDGPNVEYWEVPGMGHSARTLPVERGLELESAVLEWLLSDEATGVRPEWIPGS